MTPLSSNRQMMAQHDGAPGSVVWYISFGDLLTLLLCFFLVLTPWDRLKEQGHLQSGRAFSAQNAVNPQNGITLASEPSLRGSDPLVELPIFADEWESFSDRTREPHGWRMEEELRPLRGTAVLASIVVCDRSIDRARFIERIGELLHRDLGDPVTVQIEVFGDCNEADFLRPVSESPVGGIRVSRV